MEIAFNNTKNQVSKINFIQTKKISFSGKLFADTFSKTPPKQIETISENFDKPIKIIFSDIDGTMIGENELFINRSVFSSVKEIEQKNIPLVLSTGRSLDEMCQFSAALPFKPDYYILEQGAHIVDKEFNTIHKDSISREDSYKVIDFYKSFSQKNSFAKMVANVDGNMYFLSYADFTLQGKKDPFSFYSFLNNKIEEGKTPTKFLLFFSRALDMQEMEKIRKKAMKQMDSDNLSMLIADPHFIEIINKSSSKGTAAKFIADKYGLKLENAVGIGDSENDIPLITCIQDEGGVGVAMGNALPQLKNRANYVTSSVYDKGFAKMVGSILKHNEQFE